MQPRLERQNGMRLPEAIGQAKTDIVLDHPPPHVVVQPHPWGRLKTQGKKSILPLVGSALWAARRATEASTRDHLFPRYIRDDEFLSNSASATINKWLKNHMPRECSIHSFRHSMRGSLRPVECPKDIVDQIGGWSSRSVRESYGQGYPVGILAKWMAKISLPD
jgi:integrase